MTDLCNYQDQVNGPRCGKPEGHPSNSHAYPPQRVVTIHMAETQQRYDDTFRWGCRCGGTERIEGPGALTVRVKPTHVREAACRMIFADGRIVDSADE